MFYISFFKQLLITVISLSSFLRRFLINILICTTIGFTFCSSVFAYDVIEFYAPWCHACQNLNQYMKQNNIHVKQINVDLHKDLARKYNITYIPYLVVLEHGKIIYQGVASPELVLQYGK